MIERSVTVLGTGTMAPGIAVAFAAGGYDVWAWGRSGERLRAASSRMAAMASFLESHGLVRSGAGVSDRIRLSEDLVEALAVASVVVEAIAEDLEAKRDLTARVSRLCATDVLLATNTSGLRVSDIADGSRAPQRIVAMHFWNPAHLMPIVEVAGGVDTSPEALERARNLATTIGKLPVVLQKEVLGFLGTRMQQAVVREAIALVDAGIASPDDVDLAVRASFGARFPVIGALEAADLSGLDVIEAIHRYLLPDLDDSRQPQQGLVARVAAGDLGVKTGRGFHDWTTRNPEQVMQRRDEELVRRIRLMAAEGLLRLPEGSDT